MSGSGSSGTSTSESSSGSVSASSESWLGSSSTSSSASSSGSFSTLSSGPPASELGSLDALVVVENTVSLEDVAVLAFVLVASSASFAVSVADVPADLEECVVEDGEAVLETRDLLKVLEEVEVALSDTVLALVALWLVRSDVGIAVIGYANHIGTSIPRSR